MVKRTVKVGNAIIALAGKDDRFHKGYITGYLEFYDERHMTHFPLSSWVIRDHLMRIINESPCLNYGKSDEIQAG